LIPQRLGHYHIVGKLGEGGMGEVYRASDERLGRDVALKVLPAEWASSPDRLKRFRLEARALAALDHPNIVTVYSVEEDEGVHFLTMGLVEGESLEGRIGRPMPAGEFVDIADALAAGLSAAHEKGIGHARLAPALQPP
jgi:serine/threonine protein kinase